MTFKNKLNFDFFQEGDRGLITSEALKAEKEGKLTPSMLDLLYRKKLFHLLVPEALGGHQCSLPDSLRCFEEASYLDGSFGWTLTLGAGAGLFSAYLDPDFAEKIFKDQKAFIAGSGFPAGRAVPVEGGYKVSGRWKYISGWPHATLFTASCIVEDDTTQEPTVRAFAFLPEQVEILENWNSYGLKATASDDIKVTEQFVPEERTFVIAPETANFDVPLYTFPFEPFAQCTLGVSLLGISERFMDEAQEILEKKNDDKNGPCNELHSFYEREFHRLQEIRSTMYRHISTCWAYYEQGEEATQRELKTIKELSSRINKVALESAQAIYPYLGMEVLSEDTAVNRAWRDLHTASQHIFLRPPVERE